MEKYFIPLLLSTLAGLSTVLGGFVTFFIKRNNIKMLSIGLGFSAGVMIFLSLGELLPTSKTHFENMFAQNAGWFTLLAFVCGILIAILIDYFIPDHIQDENSLLDGNLKENDEYYDKHSSFVTRPKDWKTIKRASLITAVAVAVHNFPEGLATFFASAVDLKLGLTVVMAIAIHNIPEGIAVALPVYQATGSKRKAFYYTLLSGLSEPLGGIAGFLLINFLFPQLALGLMFGVVAGIMTYISFDTILPLSNKYDTSHYSITGLVLGLIFIGATVLAF